MAPKPIGPFVKAGRGLAALSLLMVCFALPIWGQAAKGRRGVMDDLTFVEPHTRVTQQLQDVNEFRSDRENGLTEETAGLLAGYDRFLSAAGGTWRANVDRVTGRPALVEGSGIPWIPGRGNALTWEKTGLKCAPERLNGVPLAIMAGKAMELVGAFPDLFGVESGDLVLNEAASGPMLDYLYFLDFDWTYHGLPVDHAHVVFRVNNGNLVQFGEENVCVSIAALDPVPSLSRETAWQILWGYVGGAGASDEVVDKGRLLVAPVSTDRALSGAVVAPGRGLEYRLVYVLSFRRPGAMGTWQARVDAHSGQILSFSDVNDYGHIQGGIYKTDKNPTQTEVSSPLPYADYGTGQYSDGAGTFTGTSGTSTLSGKYVTLSDNCGAISLPSDASGLIDFGTSTGTDCTTPGTGGAGNTHASRTQYWNVTQIKLKALTYMPTNSWLNGQLTDNVNLNQTCNAYWNGSSLNFFKSGGGCANTGELPGVSLHEWGHGLDSNDGNGSSPDNGSGENYGDTTAFMQTHESCLGGGFLSSNCSGYGDACTSCTGVRDVDYAKHSSGQPAKLAFANACPTSSTGYVGPCGREGHCESYVPSEANWDLATRDLVTWGMDITSAWQLMDKFWYASRPTASGAFVCTTNNSCAAGNLFNVYRVVDDCDGNLANGTPHASAIWNAFNRHEIGCSSAVNTDNACGCAVLSAPSLSGTPGYNQNVLNWSAVTGATSYDVYRNETSCTAGFTKITNTTGLSYTDTNCVNGVAYYYRVQANGAAGCPLSPMSNCKSLTPVACTTPGVPSGLTATANGNNRIDLSWSAGSPAGATYKIYRSTGACPGGTYTVIASGVTGTTYSDTTVSGGVTYSYEVTAVDSTAGCESAMSNCNNATATGSCITPPTFAGLVSVTNPGNATCTLDLAWSAATPNCGTSVYYNVYRSTSSSFTPSASNMIATGVVGTTYADNAGLTFNVPYYYVVRAVDASNGAEEFNTSIKSGVATGPGSTTQTLFSNDFETGSGTDGWELGKFNTGLTSDWRGIQSCTAHSGTKIYRFGGKNCTTNYGNGDWCFAAPGGSAGILVPTGATSVRLTFWHKWQFENGYDGALLYISTDNANFTYVPASAFISGGYNGNIGVAAWTGTSSGYSSSFQEVVVDLDAAANAISGNTGGASGKTIWIAFTGYSDLYIAADGWFLDDVQVTAQVLGTCTTGASPGSVKPVPDGKWVSGTAAKATRANADGTSIDLTWDVSTCTNIDYNLYYGKGSDLSSYTLTGSDCDMGNGGSSTWSAPAVPGGETFIWWTIVGTDGVSTESSWGKDSDGSERHPAASDECNFTAKSTAATCP